MSLYMWGCNTSRQLINQVSNAVPIPTQGIDKLIENQVPLQIAAGYDHSMVLTEAGDVFIYGSGKPHFTGRGTGMKVQGLDHETIVNIAAGAHSAYAVSNTGKVYHWGLIHEDVNPDIGGESAGSAPLDDNAQSGALTGLAQDQTTVVSVDTEARNASRATRHGNRARQLREIVRDSTEQWMLPTGDAEQEYYDELRSMGYAVEEAEERMQERGREYHGMLRMGCKRVPQPVPRLVPHLNGIRVMSVSAGYAHVMLISDKGMLYAAGYNDRGQLGLGHRINTSVFKLVDFLTTKFVVQVACGQQHTLCRAVDRSMKDSSVTVGGNTQCDVYGWGNGMLGQLGLGMKGTSKGRLFPTIIPFFQQNYPVGVTCVAAGANFSSVVVYSGEVYSFGHAEYNQHGVGSSANRDYVDPYHFFVPRKVHISDPAKAGNVCIHTVSCGLMFTIAISEDGDLYSWGWNDGGVLGHGVNYYSFSPQRIEKIGHLSDRGQITQLVCGAKHVIAIRQDLNAIWTQTYQSVLKDLAYSDLLITIDAAPTTNLLGPGGKVPTETSFRCHRAIVGARCRYLRGIIDASSYHQGTELRKDEDTNSATSLPEVTSVHLSGTHFNAVTMRSLLDYLYINRVSIPTHKRREFLLVAQELMLPNLEAAIMADITHDRTLHKESIGTYESQLQQLFGSNRDADIVFVTRNLADNQVSPNAELLTVNNANEEATTADFSGDNYAQYHFAHKFIVHRIPYFEAFMESNFKDSAIFTDHLFQDTLRHHMKKQLQVIDVTFLAADGVDFEMFLKLILYAYTGRLDLNHVGSEETILDTSAGNIRGKSDGALELSVADAMQLLAVSNRLGYNPLAQFCERRISLAIAFSNPEEVYQCYEFAQYYNLPRLEMQCLAVLRHVGYDIPATGEDETDEDDGSEPNCP